MENCDVCHIDGRRTKLHNGACWMHGTRESTPPAQPAVPVGLPDVAWLIAQIQALPRYSEEQVARRPSMYEYIDAEQLDELLAALKAQHTPPRVDA